MAPQKFSVERTYFMERNLLRTLGDNTLDLIYAKDEYGRFIFVNAALMKMTGARTAEDMLGKTDFDFNPLEAAQTYHDDDQLVIRSQQPLVDREELLHNAETGEVRWHSTTKIPLYDDNRQIIGVVGITRDITASKQTEMSVRQLNIELEERVAARTNELLELSKAVATERNLMRTLIDTVPDHIYAKDLNSKFLLANEGVAWNMNTSHQNLIGKDDSDFYDRDMAQRFYDDEQKVITTGEMLQQEEHVVDIRTGEPRWMLT